MSNEKPQNETVLNNGNFKVNVVKFQNKQEDVPMEHPLLQIIN